MAFPLADHFARFAPSYDRVNHILSLGLDVRWRARWLAAIERRPAPRILDLCAGTLACTREVLRRFSDTKVTAVDFCRPMLDRGLAQLPESLRTRVSLICSDALQLEVGPGSFDVVICSFAMRHLPQQDLLLQKIHSWLSPGGQLVIFDFFRPGTFPAKVFHHTAGRYLLPVMGQILGGFGPAYVHLHASIDRFVTRAEYEELLAAQSFGIQISEDLTLGIVALIVAVPLAGQASVSGPIRGLEGEKLPFQKVPSRPPISKAHPLRLLMNP